jgi:hypothetical protein
MMDKVQKHGSSKCSTPLSEPFRTDFPILLYHAFSVAYLLLPVLLHPKLDDMIFHQVHQPTQSLATVVAQKTSQMMTMTTTTNQSEQIWLVVNERHTLILYSERNVAHE